MPEFAVPLLFGAVTLATPLVFAAVGEIIMEKSGVLNIALEGTMLVAALSAALVTYFTASPAAGLAAGVAAAVLFGLLFALFAVGIQADQIVTGTAMNILALGLTGVLYRSLFGFSGTRLAVAGFQPWPLPFLKDIPVIGTVLFSQNVLVYAALVLTLLAALALKRTRTGLYLQAAGENPQGAEVAGISVYRLRLLAIVTGSALCGLGGVFLVLVEGNTFVEGMTAGRGFIALAIVILARWQPVRALVVALVFGLASALQFQAQAIGIDVPYQLFLALPYILTILFAMLVGRANVPAALAKPYIKE